MENSLIKKGTEVNLTIESLAYGGKGVARIDNFVVFVKNAIPGQIIRALIYKKHKGFAEARPLEILTESANAVTPKCQHFAYCGGCTLQQFDYSKQVQQKARQVVDIFKRQLGLTDFKINEIVPADPIFHYRNKMEFTVSNRRWILPDESEDSSRDFALGLHIPGRFDKILDIKECLLHPAMGNDILNTVRDLALEYKLKPYDQKTHIGFLRHLVMRFGSMTSQVMVNLVTSFENPDLLEPLVSGLLERFPNINSIINTINTKKADTVYGDYEILLHGSGSIIDRIKPLEFEISSNSFFQTNTYQASQLYEKVINAAALKGDEIVYDLYCGTGTISLFLASKAKVVHGFEMISTAVEDAMRNAISNGIGNCYFHKSNLDTFFKHSRNNLNIDDPDVIVIDPPRQGMHKDMTEIISKWSAKRIIYVSCNPTTQARDIDILLQAGYQLGSVDMVDMFPHTPHIETVAMLERK
ncbi:23S rRNA (uracil(1939)-C(5))-methyltransferase RlmD [Candidatus Neomarinimicrobiota bacterium]